MVLMTTKVGGREVPVVCPREHLHAVMREPWAKDMYRPRPYIVEGDHMHLVLNDLPPARPLLMRLRARLRKWWNT